jgi:hypothetical protein
MGKWHIEGWDTVVVPDPSTEMSKGRVMVEVSIAASKRSGQHHTRCRQRIEHGFARAGQ